MTDEFRTVVRAHEQWRPVLANQAREHLDDPLRADGPRHVDGQAFSGVLVHHGRALDLAAIGGGVEDKVGSPHHVDLERRMGARLARGDTFARTLLGQQ